MQATIVTGGQLFGMKDTPQDARPRRMTVSTRREWASVTPFGADDQRTDFTAEQVAIETSDGSVITERHDPADHAEGNAVNAQWNALGSSLLQWLCHVDLPDYTFPFRHAALRGGLKDHFFPIAAMRCKNLL